MNEKASSAQQKALQERKRGHFDKAVKRLEQAIVQFPDELDLYLDAVDACLEGGEVMQATNFLKTAQEKFLKDKDRVGQFVRDKLLAVHDPALARYVVENAVKRRDLDAALEHLEQIPDHVARDLLARTKTKKQSLKSASGGGYSLRSEMFTNDLLSALLLIRLASIKEGMAALVQMIDEKPAEQKMLQPFLAGLESKQPKVGRIRFAHACALWIGGNEADAITRLVEAARLDSTAIQICADRLQSLRDKTKFRPKVERALAEVLLLKGDYDAVAVVLRTYLAENKDSGREVIMLLKPFLDPAHGINECVWVALDAALSLDQSAVAMEILRPLHQRGNCTPDLYARLEEKSKKGFFATEIMMFHASLALELKDFPRAAEILTAVIATSPQDVHAVLGLLDKHRTSHPALEELCRKHAQPENAEVLAEEGDFTNFDHNDFSLSKAGGVARPAMAAAPRAPSAPTEDGEKPASRFAEERKKPAEKQSFIETREFTFDDDGTPDAQSAPNADEPVENTGDDDAGVFETSSDLRLSPGGGKTAERKAAKTPEKSSEKPFGKLFTEPEPKLETKPAPKPVERPAEKHAAAAAALSGGAGQARAAVKLQPSSAAIAATEAHVQNVAGHLGAIGAAAFFHIDENEGAREPVQAVESAAAATSTLPSVDPEPVHAGPEIANVAPAAPEEPAAPTPKTFESELACFRKGELDNAAVIALIEQAVENSRLDELHDLLAFEPKDNAEKFAQRFYEAEHHVLSNRPLPALEILTKLGDSPLTDEQKERVWFRTAVCQRTMNDFSGANDTLKRLLKAFPGHPEYDRLARRNYEQYLAEQSNDVAVLQKTTSLD